MPSILLIDNGSRQPAATLQLRRLAAALAERLGRPVAPVSLLHSSSIAPALLGGVPAATLLPYLRARVAAGERDFLALPLFFGPSRALSEFIPQEVAALSATLAPVAVRIADVLCPLPAGEPLLVDILEGNLIRAREQAGLSDPPPVVLVDHGSPIPAVNAVRRWLAQRLAERLGAPVLEAVMERRPEADYDFNGPLLEDLLTACALASPHGAVALAMQFIAPGRHAGAGGDIDRIRAKVMEAHPGLRVLVSPLVGDHPGLVDILLKRAVAALNAGATLNAGNLER